MAKFIYFNIPSTGHINPSSPLIKRLIAAGNEVIYANTENRRAQAEATGAQFVPYPPLEHMAFFDEVNLKNFAKNGLRLMQLTESIMPFVLDLVEREQPDIIIYDSLAHWGRIAAHHAQCRMIAFYATFVLTSPVMPGASLRSTLTMIAQIIPLAPKLMSLSRRVKNTYGFNPLTSPNMTATDQEITIAFTARAFHPDAERFNESYKFIGPTLEQRPDDSDFDFDALTGSPLIYISLGTIVNQNVQFYKTCFEAFGNQPGQYILSVGKETDIGALGTIPDNFIVRNFVPQLDILQRVDVFITHGGLNSTQEGLIYGVPLVVFPQHMEQAMVARQVIQHGSGLGVQVKPPYGVTDAQTLRASVQKVLADASYKQNAEKLGDAIRAAGGAERGVDEIMRFVEKR